MIDLSEPFFENIIKILNELAQSTGEVYYVYNFREQTFRFSENMPSVFAPLVPDRTYYTLEEWQQNIDSRDLEQYLSTYRSVLSKTNSFYNFNYRLKTQCNEDIWVNSRGSATYDAQDQPLYVLGRISGNFSGSPSFSFRNNILKQKLHTILETMQPGFLMLININDMKFINLKNGRAYGDSLLNKALRVMQDELAPDRTVFRISGDWFAFNLPSVTPEEVTAIFERIQTRLKQYCTISGGCVSYTDYHVDEESTLLQYAETALVCAKKQGKNRLVFFTPEHYQEKLRELELREELQQSVNRDFEGFTLFYQAQIRSESYTLYGAEALLRYHSPRLGDVYPSEFIPLLEQSDLIYPVGLWVLRQALKDCRKWRETLPDFHISINMSYRQLEHESITLDVLSVLKGISMPGSALTIEVTESMELSNYPQLNNIFYTWKKEGIELSVDDFGTGYSSLSRLKELDVDEIKIDKIFVRDIQHNAYNYRLLSNIIELADSSLIRVCCEGLSNTEELAVLNDLHPFMFQGFFFGKPCCARDFTQRYIQTQNYLQVLEDFKPCLEQKQLPEAITDSSSISFSALRILDAEDNLFCLCDLETYELYYMNAAARKIFGVGDCRGKKCYKTLHGLDKPCPSCQKKMLLQDSFYMWESWNDYCGRHFLIKEKIIPYGQKDVRLVIAQDITKKEYLSQSSTERLAFAKNVVDYMNTLSACPNYSVAVNRVLSSVADFYQADRSYLFERNPLHPDQWDNTFEWCASNVSAEKENLQGISSSVLTRWMKLFDSNQSIILLNLDPLREQSPQEWEILHAQDIQRLIAVPIRENNRTIGFIGVDNPRYCIHDDSQIRVLGSFLLARIQQDRNEHRYQTLLQESNQELLQAMNVGFWTFNASRDRCGNQMIFDNTTCKLLGIATHTSPEDCYFYWRSRLTEAAENRLCTAFQQMMNTNQVIQVEYPWKHPARGIITLRFSGILIEDVLSTIRFKGYCRIVDNHPLQ